MFQRLLCWFGLHSDKIVREGSGEAFVGKFQLRECSQCVRKVVRSVTRGGTYTADCDPRIWIIASRARLKPEDLLAAQEWAK